jgi:hypothetical protein
MVPYLPYPRRSYAPPTPAAPALAVRPQASGAPDLQTQLEAILDSVWKSEADWRFNDRLDMAFKTRRTAR